MLTMLLELISQIEKEAVEGKLAETSLSRARYYTEA
jgi:hypothetical protein